MINHTVGLCVLEQLEYKYEKNDTPFLLFISLLSFSFFYYFQSVQLLLVDVYILSNTVVL